MKEQEYTILGINCYDKHRRAWKIRFIT